MQNSKVQSQLWFQLSEYLSLIGSGFAYGNEDSWAVVSERPCKSNNFTRQQERCKKKKKPHECHFQAARVTLMLKWHASRWHHFWSTLVNTAEEQFCSCAFSLKKKKKSSGRKIFKFNQTSGSRQYFAYCMKDFLHNLNYPSHVGLVRWCQTDM